MRVFISADMEGITGIVSRQDVSQSEDEYHRARRLLHNDVNAAIEGAFDGGADTVLVNDSHATMTNLQPEQVDGRAELLRGRPKQRSMMAGMTEEFDVAFFVGYHAKAGTAEAVLNHTISGRNIMGVFVNGTEVGELGMNARCASSFGVPVGLVTGDDKTAREAETELGDVETVEVKRGFGRYAARCLSPEETRAAIRASAERVMDRATADGFDQQIELDEPTKIEVAWRDTDSAQVAAAHPYVDRIDGTTTAVEMSTYLSAHDAALAMISAGIQSG